MELVAFLSALLGACVLLAVFNAISAKFQRAKSKSHRHTDDGRKDR
jgi:hypothetical protein